MEKPVFRRSIIVPSFAIRLGTINLKAAAIFYDRLHVLDESIFEADVPGSFGDDFDFLQKEGVIQIFESRLQWPQEMAELITRTKDRMAQAIFSNEERRGAALAIGASGMARLEAASLTRSQPGRHFVPHTVGAPASDLMLPQPSEETEKDLAKVDRVRQATEVVFNNLPVPDELTPWEDIFAFREEHGTERYARSLHKWIRDASTEARIDEVDIEFKDEMDRLRAALRARDMKVRLAKTRMILPWLDMINRTAKAILALKPSELVSPIVETQQRRIEILEAESRVQENALYMIAHAEAHFGARVGSA
jgi:hypothetical protein